MTKKTVVKEGLTFGSVLAEADRAQTVISDKQESVAQHLFTLAQTLSTPEQFEAGCAAAEGARKQKLTQKAADKGMNKKERQKLVRLPAAWSNAKSVLLRGWEDYKLIPNDYDSYSQYKEDKGKAVKDNAVHKYQGTGVSADGADAALDAMSSKNLTTVLFADLLARVRELPPEVQEEISLHFDELISKYEGVAPEEEGNDDVYVEEDAHIMAQAEQQAAAQ